MRSNLEISNLALRHLGMKKITSLSGTDPSSVHCNDFFEACRDDLFAEHKWPFATTFTLLNASVEDVPVGWTYAYDNPMTENAAAVWAIFNEATTENKYEQEFEKLYIPSSGVNVLVSDLDEAYAEITYIVSDTTLWSAKFDMMMSYRLAAEICVGLTGDAEKGLKLMQIYNAMLGEEKRIRAAEQVKKPNRQSDYIDGRS